MKEKTLWYGYLDADQKSSPIVFDSRLQTNNGETIYLFNFMRGEILEYRRRIVEPKLRELKPKTTTTIKQLEAAYAKAQRNFRPTGNRILPFPTRGPAGEEQEKKQTSEELNELMEDNGEEFANDEDWLGENS